MKKVISLSASALLLFSLTTQAMGADFSDVPSGHWANPYVNVAKSAQLVSGGAGTNNFYPENPMTYGEFAVIIVNGAFQGKVQPSASDTHWADPYLNVLLSENLLQDSENAMVVSTTATNWQNFQVTREDAATVAARLMERGNFKTGSLYLATAFTDISSGAGVATGQLQDIADVVANGVMTGQSKAFGVGKTSTRAEISVIVKNMLEMNILRNKDGSAYGTGHETTTPETTKPDTTTPEPETKPEPEKEPEPEVENKEEAYVAEVFRLVNEERAKVGAKPLIWHNGLMDAAQFKSEEMNTLNYYSHISPVYGDFTGIIDKFVDRSKFWMWGENLVKSSSPQAAMRAWMNSPGHKENILNKGFTHIGIGVSGRYWTQQFGAAKNY